MCGNYTNNREAELGTTQFGCAFPRILQAIWEADPAKVPMRISKMDGMNEYQLSTLQPYQMRNFTYSFALVLEYYGIVISINLVLPVGWVDSTKFFCAFSETMMDVASALLDTLIPVLEYGYMTNIPVTGLVPPHVQKSLTHIDCYMDDVISAVQGGP